MKRLDGKSALTAIAVFMASEEAEYIVARTYNVNSGNWMS